MNATSQNHLEGILQTFTWTQRWTDSILMIKGQRSHELKDHLIWIWTSMVKVAVTSQFVSLRCERVTLTHWEIPFKFGTNVPLDSLDLVSQRSLWPHKPCFQPLEHNISSPTSCHHDSKMIWLDFSGHLKFVWPRNAFRLKLHWLVEAILRMAIFPVSFCS